ncbi:hypothetical protein J8L88_03265 [Aquimarina sp. MMG015]|uniref:hypothetical protein n=1 Tax=Aquimarina sp. MMG015 TaxID=2822689 RepID=UPI001B3A6258|nr:hypothetical protein [Aquimarina sp. MMG015]MBQ4801858.1 hypothetical protein [Aquimarina sp. MMG015]
MDKTDQNIHNTLTEYNPIYVTHPELEDNIMDIVKKQKNYKEVLIKTRHKVKAGLIVSVILLLIYIILTYTDLLKSIDQNEESIKLFYPSILATIVVILVYFQGIFGISILKKEN